MAGDTKERHTDHRKTSSESRKCDPEFAKIGYFYQNDKPEVSKNRMVRNYLPLTGEYR